MMALFSIKISFFCWFHSTNWRIRRSAEWESEKKRVFLCDFLFGLFVKYEKEDEEVMGKKQKRSYSHCDLCSTHKSVCECVWKMTLRHAINHFQFAWTFYASIQFHRVTHSITSRCTFVHTHHLHQLCLVIFRAFFRPKLSPFFNYLNSIDRKRDGWTRKNAAVWFECIHKISIRFNHDIFVNYFFVWQKRPKKLIKKR